MLWETIITLTDKLKAERRAAISSEAWSALGKYENYVEIKAYLVLEFGIFGMKGLLKDYWKYHGQAWNWVTQMTHRLSDVT